MTWPGNLFEKLLENKYLGSVQLCLQVNSSHFPVTFNFSYYIPINQISLKIFLDIQIDDVFNISSFYSFPLLPPITFFSAIFFWFKVNSYQQKLQTIKCKYGCYILSLVTFKSYVLMLLFSC